MVKNLIIINAIMLLATEALKRWGVDLTALFGLFYPQSEMFRPWQILTHFFMHGGIFHLFFNMFGLFMFGRMLEIRWGAKRFLFFYMITAFSAALLHFLVVHFQVQSIMHQLDPVLVKKVIQDGPLYQNIRYPYTIDKMNALHGLINSPVVGASGAIFGILGACFVLFPNTILYLIFPPIPIRLKVAVTIYGLYELYRGLENAPGDNIAHFAHLGGLVAGIIIVKYWNKTRRDSFF